jgi:flagellar biosynthesis/type III secretory pathway protein FliH
VQQAIATYRELTADEKFLRLVWMREDAERNEASALAYAKDEGKLEGIRIGEQKGIRIGEQKGIRIGEQKGIRIGERNARKDMALEMLAEGTYSLEAIARLAKTTVEQVQEWARETK